MEALASIATILCIVGNAILGIWCCIWGSDRGRAAGLLIGWIIVTAIALPILFIAYGSDPVLPGAYVMLWSYYAIGTALFIYFVKMVLVSDHIRNG